MNTTIKILGTGCPNCQRTFAVVEEVIKENNIDATIEKVEDIMEIMKYNVMSTPAIVVDEDVKIKGRVPLKTEVLEVLKSNKAESDSTNAENCCSPDSCC